MRRIDEAAPVRLPSLYERVRSLTEDQVVGMLLDFFEGDSPVALEDAAKCFIALYAWRDVTGYPAPTDQTGQATMYNLNDFGPIFGFGNDPSVMSSIASIAEGRHWITTDLGPSEQEDAEDQDANYAYLDPGGYEAGLGIIGSLLSDDISPIRVPIADGIVDVNHNRKAVEEADVLVGQVIREIEKSNTLDTEKKDLIKSALELGRQVLKQPLTYVATIGGALLKPLYDAYASALEEAAKPVVLEAINAVLKLLGL